jgi:hypothetical protein
MKKSKLFTSPTSSQTVMPMQCAQVQFDSVGAMMTVINQTGHHHGQDVALGTSLRQLQNFTILTAFADLQSSFPALFTVQYSTMQR